MKNIIIITLLLISLVSCTEEKDVDYKDYKIITLASEISSYYDIKLDTSGIVESGRIRKYIDGSFDFKYSYELLETNDYLPLYYSIKIEKENSIKDAIENFNLSKVTLLTTNKSIGQDIIEIDSLGLYGEQDYYAIRTKDNEPNGLFFMTRKNEYLYTLIMTGLYSSDHSLILDLVIPKIEELDKFSLKRN